ncbi:MAG: metal ABC transporter substrate-binding protein [Candidatus Eremiobacterota bacterium]
MQKRLFNVLFFLCLIIITGCNRAENTSAIPDKTQLVVVTSFYPVYISTINITKDVPDVKVINLTESFTGCLHNYSMTADNMKTIATADIFVVNGAGMEGFLDKVIKEQSDLKIVDASKDIELIKEEHHHKHDEKSHEEDEHEKEHESHECTHEEVNPHVWVSVSNLIKQINNIEKDLSLYDPSHKELYRKNADAYIEKLYKLKEEMNSEIKDIKDRNIITFHEAFPYFAKDFGLNILAVIEREPGTEPNAKELAETIEIIRKHKVKALFAEPQYSSKSADVISKETGLKVFILDPAATGPMEYDAYINIMKNNIKVIKEALK